MAAAVWLRSTKIASITVCSSSSRPLQNLRRHAKIREVWLDFVMPAIDATVTRVLLLLLHKLADRITWAVADRLAERRLAQVAAKRERAPQPAAIFDQMQLLQWDAALLQAALDRASQAGRFLLNYY